MFRFFNLCKKKITSFAAYSGRSYPAERNLCGQYILPLSTNKQQFLGRSYHMWNKKPTRCHLVLYLFLLYKLLNMFRATLCPSSGADDLVVFLPHVVWCRGCVGSQIRLAGCVSIGKYVARCAAKIPLSRQLLRIGTRWLETC